MNVGFFKIDKMTDELKTKYKLTNKLPHLRMYKNTFQGNEKNQRSFQIYMNNDVEEIIDEIHEAIISNYVDVTEQMLSNMAINKAMEEKKNVLIYYYSDPIVSIHFKAISAVAILQDDFAFLSLANPSEEMMS